MIYIVNCTLPYIFDGVNKVEMVNTNGKLTLIRRLRNRFSATPFIPEDLSEYKRLSDAEEVILFGGTRQFILRCKHIEDHVPSTCRLNLYLWNPMFFYTDDIGKLSKRWRVWSFSKDEAKQYRIGYAETIYNAKLTYEAAIETDMFFVGLDKGRKPLLDMISRITTAEGLIVDINVVDNIRSIYTSKYVGRMSYEEVRKRIARTRALIDIVQSNQKGLTQRVMESIFFKKKLITNNASVKNYKFYTPDNIFVIGEDDYSHLKEFVLSPYKEVDGFDTNIFDVHQWLDRMRNNKEFHE